MTDIDKQASYVDSTSNAIDHSALPAEGELVLGTLVAISAAGQPLVSCTLPGFQDAVPAIATIELHAQHIGRQVGMLFAKTPEKTPVVVGLIHNPLHNILDTIEVAERNEDQVIFDPQNSVASKAKGPLDDQSAHIDGKRVVIEGKDEVVLKCGEASITLNKSGKISIRGKYLLNRSTGVNRIMGGSVQVN